MFLNNKIDTKDEVFDLRFYDRKAEVSNAK